MRKNNKILLVEGESDKKLFEGVCERLSLETNVRVAPPKDFGAKEFNTKGGMFNMLPSFISQMADGHIKKFAAIMDADYPDPVGGGGMGYAETVSRFTEIVSGFGFSPIRRAGQPSGNFYAHNDGLEDISLWVMPNNKDNGMTEDWIKSCIIDAEANLLEHVELSISNIPKPIRFKEIHKAKARIATWLAWQKIPGQGAYRALEHDLFNTSCASYTHMANWLNYIYK